MQNVLNEVKSFCERINYNPIPNKASPYKESHGEVYTPLDLIYHMLNNSDIKAYICKITSNHKSLIYDTDNVSFLEIFINNFNKHYYVEYNEFNYTINMNPELFIEDLKNILY